jgi:dihydroorotate dehydrogenase electron transfer subunit
MQFVAHVRENRRLSELSFVLRLGHAEPLGGARPGQFVMLRGAWGRDPLLPRAFSLLRTLPGGECEILVKAIGRGTRLLQQLESCAELQLLGPLGQPFAAPEVGRTDLLVAGGVGLAPLLWQAELAQRAGCETELFYGARTASELVLLDEIERAGCRVHLTTDDGSRGLLGRVTQALARRLESPAAGSAPRVLTCGPNPMMRQVVELALAHLLPCQVSVEGEMACGIGVCLGCAVPLVDGTRPFGYACTDGPVFDAARIVIP